MAKQDFPELTPEDYGVMRYHRKRRQDLVRKPKKLTLLSPAKAVQGRAYAEKLDRKKFNKWHRFSKGAKDYTFLKPKKAYALKGKRHRKPLEDITDEQLWQEIIRKTEAANNGRPDLIIKDATQLFIPQDEEEKYHAHIGEGSVLSADIQSKSSDRVFTVFAKNTLTNSTDWLNVLFCDCKYATNARKKLGPTDFQALCIHTAALLFYAARYPSKVQKMSMVRGRNRDREFCPPFTTFYDDPRLVSFDWLMFEVLTECLVNKTPDYYASIRLKHFHRLFPERIKEELARGYAGFEATVDKQDLSMPAPLKGFLFDFTEDLRKKGYEKAGYKRELAETGEERVCQFMINRYGDSVSFYYNKKYPPMFIFTSHNPDRWRTLDSKLQTVTPDTVDRVDKGMRAPTVLFKPRLAINDRTGEIMTSDLRLPTRGVPGFLVPAYRKMIDDHIDGGLSQLRKRIPKHTKLYRQLFH